MPNTKLSLQDKLPLTCSRTGTCCHGKMVMLNPWELLHFATEKKMTASDFRDTYCEFGGIRLRFDGKPGWKNLPACSQYIEGFGCSNHLGRPLACRLYPLGRQLQNGEAHYMFLGKEFPCLEGCPEVVDLPQMSVGEYIHGQGAEIFEKAQDEYLDLMQGIADIAFMLLLETGLAESGDRLTLPLWKKMGNEDPEVLKDRIGKEWMECLMLPEITDGILDPIVFAKNHSIIIQEKAQEQFGSIQTMQELHQASVLMMGLALHLARGLGANPEELAEHWIEIAKENGALE